MKVSKRVRIYHLTTYEFWRVEKKECYAGEFGCIAKPQLEFSLGQLVFSKECNGITRHYHLKCAFSVGIIDSKEQYEEFRQILIELAETRVFKELYHQ
jgi:hypothetical protein